MRRDTVCKQKFYICCCFNKVKIFYFLVEFFIVCVRYYTHLWAKAQLICLP